MADEPIRERPGSVKATRPVIGRAWRRLALVVPMVVGMAWLSPILAATVNDLLAEADRLRGAPEPREEDLRRAIGLYEQAARLQPTAADIQVKLAETAMSMGPWAAGDPLRWYELGARSAERAVTLDANSADAHFLLAAHRGQIARRQRSLRGLAVPGELEQHLLRALALNPRHPRALHMMGVLLRDTPVLLRGSLKGSRSDVERYLVAAVAADPDFAEARIDLAKHYRDAGNTAEARRQAEAVMQMAPANAPPRLAREISPGGRGAPEGARRGVIAHARRPVFLSSSVRAHRTECLASPICGNA